MPRRLRITVRGMIVAVALAALAAALASREYYAQRGRALRMRADQCEFRARLLAAEIEGVSSLAEQLDRNAADGERRIEGLEKWERLRPEGHGATREGNLALARRLAEQTQAEARSERARLPGLRARLAHWSGLHARYLAASRAPWRPMPPDPPEPK